MNRAMSDAQADVCPGSIKVGLIDPLSKYQNKTKGIEKYWNFEKIFQIVGRAVDIGGND